MYGQDLSTQHQIEKRHHFQKNIFVLRLTGVDGLLEAGLLQISFTHVVVLET